MPIFEKYRLWLKGSFTCKRCGKELHAMSFGFGDAICPDCYRGEQPFLFLDNSYWLNRILARLLNQRPTQPKPTLKDPILLIQIPQPPTIEVN
jgi:hypothetical protein